MVDASPKMSAARLSHVIERQQIGVPPQSSSSKSFRLLGSMSTRFIVYLAFVGRTAANPTNAPPPPIRTYSLVPPPPSPPPGLISSFNPEFEFSTARLGSWKGRADHQPQRGTAGRPGSRHHLKRLRRAFGSHTKFQSDMCGR